MSEIISQSEARLRGLSYFFTGRPCKHGHVCPRYVSNGMCLECTRKRNHRNMLWRAFLPAERMRVRAAARKSVRFHVSNYSPELYDRLVVNQGGACCICGDLPADGKVLHADHDHVTGKPRRPLCSRCNLALGFAHDDPELLMQAAQTGEPKKISAAFRNNPVLLALAAFYLRHFQES